GDNPTLVYAYGGFNVSLTPNFRAERFAWLEQGGVFVQVNLRGGGEYGEKWHQAGTLGRKQNVFDDLYAATSMTYPNVYRSEMTGAQLKDIMEDVCDNLFNKDPFLQQGGDMVRVRGFTYDCAVNAEIGSRILNMRLSDTGEPIEADKTYTVGGWASVAEGTEGPAIYDLMEQYITSKGTVNVPDERTVNVVY
ncbi:MAG TPA: prolyl oligopeptidase family serine peptidase, partial [Rhizobiaceae bacterium]|nr:prolyl oligopeptidase family serine peptidase [Rhizobiaceae bacterium]